MAKKELTENPNRYPHFNTILLSPAKLDPPPHSTTSQAQLIPHNLTIASFCAKIPYRNRKEAISPPLNGGPLSTLYNSDFAVFISPVEKATLFERFERLFTHVSPTIILSVNEGVESLSMFSVRSSIAIDLYLIRGFLKIVSELGGSVSLLRYETWDENRGIFRSNWHQPTSDPQNP